MLIIIRTFVVQSFNIFKGYENITLSLTPLSVLNKTLQPSYLTSTVRRGFFRSYPVQNSITGKSIGLEEQTKE